MVSTELMTDGRADDAADLGAEPIPRRHGTTQRALRRARIRESFGATTGRCRGALSPGTSWSSADSTAELSARAGAARHDRPSADMAAGWGRLSGASTRVWVDRSIARRECSVTGTRTKNLQAGVASCGQCFSLPSRSENFDRLPDTASPSGSRCTSTQRIVTFGR
jgi:hypothetical protein